MNEDPSQRLAIRSSPHEVVACAPLPEVMEIEGKKGENKEEEKKEVE